MTEQNRAAGEALLDAIYEEWYSEHGEYDDLSLLSADELRDYILRAVGSSAGAELIAIERRRQVQAEGYTIEHDQVHGAAQLAQAAEAYLTGSPKMWPWAPETLKMSADIRRNLVKAGALIAAAIDVIDADPGASSSAAASA